MPTPTASASNAPDRDGPRLSPELIERQVDRLLSADLLKGSLTLHRLLRFIVQAKIDGREEEVKETVLATEVFARRTDFDNRIDPVVRVQAHRLRRKLDVYYAGPGKEDLVLISIPKGSYVPEIRLRGAESAPDVKPAAAAAPKPEAVAPETPGRWNAGILVGVAFAAALAGYWLGSTEPSSTTPLVQPSPKVAALWAPMLAADAPPTSVVFTIPLFLSNEKGLLRYSGPYTAPTGAGLLAPEELRRYVDPGLLDAIGPVLFNRTYANIGQLYQMNALTELFTAAGKPLRLRPSRLVTPDEGDGRHLILLNGNGLELVGQTLRHFQMRAGSFGYKSVDQPAVVNLAPSDGEQAEYTIEFDAETQERKADYAILAVLPGLRDGLSVVLSDGLTTLGNWAAIRAATSEQGVTQLEQLLGGPAPRYFEAVVRAELSQDQLVDFRVVAARAY